MRRLSACALASLLMIGASAQAQVSPLFDDVRRALQKGDYEEAEIAASALVRSMGGHALSPPQIADAMDLLVEALWRNGRLVEVRPRAQQALDLRARLKLPVEPSLRNLAAVSLLEGEPARAVQLLQRIGAPDGTAPDELASALTSATRYADARATIDRIRRERVLRPVDERTLARDLEVEGTLLQAQGEYVKSGPLLDRALSTMEALQPDHPDVARLLGLVGDQRWFEGNLSAAYEAYTRSLALAERVLRPGHPALAPYLRNLALALQQRGDIRGALALRQRALTLAQRSLGMDHREVAIDLNDVAVSESALGDYTAALAHYERALAITKRHATEIDPEVATYTYNLALSYARLRDVDESLRLHNQAIAVWQRINGASHPFVGLAWATLGSTFLEFGLPQQALPALQRGLAVQQRSEGTMSRDVAQTTTDLARTRLALRDLPSADALSAHALELWSAVGEDAGRSEAAAVRGDVLMALGLYENARALYAESLAVSTRLFGSTNPAPVRLRLKLADAAARLGHSDAAIDDALQAEAAGRDHLNLMLRSLPERMAVSYAAARANGLHLAASLVVATRARGETASRLFEAVIRARAIVLDEIITRRRTVIGEGDELGLELWEALTKARDRLAFLAVGGPAGRSPQQYAALVDEARRDKEVAERALAARSAAFSAEVARSDIGFEQVRAALPPRTGLVSFFRYVGQPDGIAGYLAFVVTPAADLQIVPLGNGNRIDSAVDEWHRAAARIPASLASEADYRRVGARLRELIWDPIVPAVGPVERLLIVPDATLNLVNFGALPIGGSSYLVEQLPVLHYLSAERDVVPSPRARGSGMLAMGGAAFDNATPVGIGDQSRGGLETCVTLGSLHFAPLVATEREVTEVAAQWTPDATVLTGTRATERAFKQRAPGARVLHLATHGFFLPADCDGPARGTRAVGGLANSGRRPAPQPSALNAPLLLSGLALAGANRHSARNSEDDGILTAEEVAAMDLETVEWAVLSACDTGRGQIQDGEGVFGLRRAFQVAGVRTVIMSLWSVEDEATRVWMKALYDARLRQGMSTADAVRQASLRMLQSRRASGTSTHPFYWAAFVAAGDWR